MKKDILWRWRFSRGRLLSRWWNSLSVIFSILVFTWIVLAVELTLFWNAIDGVYNLSTVGQLIPFIIGILGLVRSLHLVIMEYLEMVCFAPNSLIFFAPLIASSLVHLDFSKSNVSLFIQEYLSQESIMCSDANFSTSKRRQSVSSPEIRLDQPSASWRYLLRDGSFAHFDAIHMLKRRWSLDAPDTRSRPSAKRTDTIDLEEGDHIEPVLPFPTNLSSTSLLQRTLRHPTQVKAFLERWVLYMNMGEWRYPLKDGRTQVFSADDCGRRWSSDEKSLYNGVLPYRIDRDRPKLRIPLREKWAARRDHTNSQLELYDQENSGENLRGRLDLLRQGRYVLKDGRTVIFPSPPWDPATQISPITYRRFSYDDRDNVVNDVRSASSMSISSGTLSSNVEPVKRGNASKILNCILRFFVITFRYMQSFIVRLLGELRHGCGHQDEPESSDSEDQEHSHSPSRTFLRSFRGRIAVVITLVFCCPCAFPFMWQRIRKRRERMAHTEKIKKRLAFEKAYIRRHGAHSKPYLQSELIRDWSREQPAGPKKEAKIILEKFFRSFGLDLRSRQTDPEKRKQEAKDRLQAWASNGLKDLESARTKSRGT